MSHSLQYMWWTEGDEGEEDSVNAINIEWLLLLWKYLEALDDVWAVCIGDCRLFWARVAIYPC